MKRGLSILSGLQVNVDLTIQKRGTTKNVRKTRRGQHLAICGHLDQTKRNTTINHHMEGIYIVIFGGRVQTFMENLIFVGRGGAARTFLYYMAFAERRWSNINKVCQ